MIDPLEVYLVCRGMTEIGGSFVKALGQTLNKADHINQQKIKTAWPEYWSEYLEAGKRIDDRDKKFSS